MDRKITLTLNEAQYNWLYSQVFHTAMLDEHFWEIADAIRKQMDDQAEEIHE